jgi:predicted phosphodiesterase
VAGGMTSALVAVLSDIHSNVFALQAVLRDADQAGASEVWVSGDTFGYYPWAAESFGLLRERDPIAVLGNHDGWVARPASAPGNIVGEIARHNAGSLAAQAPAALAWLASLPVERRFESRGWRVRMTHGTPDDALDGRYYPDDDQPYSWLPGPGEVLILGQTHYPVARGAGPTGLLLNPGSVGQPRDGNPMPSWALLDLAQGTAELRRTAYDQRSVMARLADMGWDSRVILALDKR